MSRVRLGDRFYDDDVCYFKAGAQAADQCYGSCCAVTIRLKRIGVDSHTTTSSNSVVAPLAAVAGRILKVFASPKPAGNVALVISLPLVGAGISARVVALIAPAPFLPCDMTSAGARLPAEVYVICGLQAGAGHNTVIFAFAPLASVMALGLCAKSGVTL